MNKHLYLQSSSKSTGKATSKERTASTYKGSDVLLEAQSNFTSLLSNLQSKVPAKRPHHTSKEKVAFMPAPYHIGKEERNSHSNKPSKIISDLTHRLNSLERQLNSYQSKAKEIKVSFQKSLTPARNKVIQVGHKGVPSANIVSLNSNDNVLNDNESKQNQFDFKELLYNGRNYRTREVNEERSMPLLSGYDSRLDEEMKGMNCLNEASMPINCNELIYVNKANYKGLLSQIASLKEMNKSTKEDLLQLTADFTRVSMETQSLLIDKLLKDKAQSLQSLTTELKEKTQQNDSLQKDNLTLTKQTHDLLQFLSQSKQQRDQSIAELALLQPQLSTLAQRNIDLEASLQQTKDNYEKSHSEHKAQIQQLEAQMLKQASEVNSIAKDYQNTTDSIQHFVEVNEKLSKEIELKNSKILTAKSQSNGLSSQVKTKDRIITSLTSTNTELKEAIKENEAKANKKLSAVMKELKEYKAKHDQLQKRLALTEALNVNQHKPEEYEKEIKRLNEVIAEMRNENEEFVNDRILLNEEIVIAKQELQRERHKTEELNRKGVVMNKEAEERIGKLQEVIEEMRGKAEEMAQRINEVTQAHLMEKETFELKLKELNETIGSYQQEIAGSNQKLSLLTSELALASNQLETQDASHKEEVRILEDKLREAIEEHSTQMAKLNQEIALYKSRNDELTEESKKQNETITNLNDTITKQTDALHSLELSHSALAIENSRFINEIIGLKSTMTQLNADIELQAKANIEKLAELEQINKRLLEQFNLTETEMKQLTQESTEKETTIVSLNALIKQLKANNNELFKDYSAMKESTVLIEEHQGQIEAIKTELNEKEITLKAKQKEIDDLYASLMNYKEQVKVLTDENESQRDEVQSLKAQLDNQLKVNSEINEMIIVLINEEASFQERNRAKESLYEMIQGQQQLDKDPDELKADEQDDNSIDNEEEENEEEDDDDAKDDKLQLDDEEIEEVNNTPGQRNSTLKKKGYSTELLK